jgi:hypothetical protein
MAASVRAPAARLQLKDLDSKGLERQPYVDAAVLGAGSVTIARAREEAVVAARRGMRVIVPITVDIAAAIVSLVVIAVIVGAHRMMIIRPVLCVDQRRRQSGHGKGGKGKYCRLQKVLAHGLLLGRG